MFLPKPNNTLVVILCLILLCISTFHLSSQNSSNESQRVRINFTSDGMVRPLLLAFTPDNAATDGFDYGYDALNADHFPNDMFWMIAGQQYVIQGVGQFNYTRLLPLGVFVTNPGSITISLTDLENFDTDIEVYIYDALLNTNHQINLSDFQMSLEANTYMDRFYLAFSSNSVLSVEAPLISKVLVKYLNASEEIFIQSSEISSVEKVHLINILGQSIQTWQKRELDTFHDEIRIPIGNISKGNYVINVETNFTSINKQFVVSN